MNQDNLDRSQPRGDECKAVDAPKCDKCGAEITTGFMVFFCPQREACEFFESDWDEEMKSFVRLHWKETQLGR